MAPSHARKPSLVELCQLGKYEPYAIPSSRRGLSLWSIEPVLRFSLTCDARTHGTGKGQASSGD
jgi:hypothetical protein